MFHCTFCCVLLYFLLILSVCLCVCVWAMLPDSNKMIMMMIAIVGNPNADGKTLTGFMLID